MSECFLGKSIEIFGSTREMYEFSPGTDATGNMLTGHDSWLPIEGRTESLGNYWGY